LIAQLDPGFTTEGFLANFAIQALAAFVGTIGAFVVAWLFYRRTSKEERTKFEETLAHERKLLQEQFAHDLEMRRQEDRNRRQEREDVARQEGNRLLAALSNELDINIKAIRLMAGDEAHQFRLRRDALDLSLVKLETFPEPLAENIQRLSMFVDRYNTLHGATVNRRFLASTLQEINQPIADTRTALDAYLASLGPAEQ
jgi:hypothetical protein